MSPIVSHAVEPLQRTRQTEVPWWVAAAAGAALAMFGARRRSLLGVLLTAGGGALLVRAVFSHRGHGDTRLVLSGRGGIHVNESIIINRPPAMLYEYWRDLESLPRIMRHPEEVRVLDETRSHWVGRGPAGQRVAWDAEIIHDDPPHRIGWRSLPGASLVSAGSVTFTPTALGETRVDVHLQYEAPAGRAGAMLAWLFGTTPGQAIREDLRRYKMWMEAGEIPTGYGQPRSRSSMVNSD